jgi:hypothetical protein
MFPRIDATGNELPRVIFTNGLNSIEKYDGSHNLKEYIKWIKETLDTVNVDENNYNIPNKNVQVDEEHSVIDISS